MSEMTAYVLRPKRRGSRIPKAIKIFKGFPTMPELAELCDHEGEYILQPRERKCFSGKAIHFKKTIEIEYVPRKTKKHWWQPAEVTYTPVEKAVLTFDIDDLILEFNRQLGKEEKDDVSISKLSELIELSKLR